MLIFLLRLLMKSCSFLPHCLFQLAVERLVKELKEHKGLEGKVVWKVIDNPVERRKVPNLGDLPLQGFVNRTEAMREVLQFLNSYREFKVKTKAPRLGAIHGGVGTGKTKFIYILACGVDISGEIPDAKDLALYQELRGVLKEYVPIAITFNHFSSLFVGEDPLVAVAIRALYS